MILFDSHAHLDIYKQKETGFIINNADLVGVKFILSIGDGVESSLKTLELSKESKNIFAACGIHPHDAQSSTDEDLEELEKIIKEKAVVAVGETGLDFFKNYSPEEKQINLFKRHIEVARRRKKPLIVHCRDAYDKTLEILKKENAYEPGVIFHCYSGSLEIARKLFNENCYFSAAGPLTFQNAYKLREIFTKIPLEKILIETDCPYLSPHPLRGKRNEPANLVYTAKKLAEIRSIKMEELSKILFQNTLRAFKLKVDQD
ncbi:MAG: TatD family hydrolase [Actinomycetia bacterium]|nr:TatD family hydrolase [Actinomycetes bacterium]